MLSLGQVWTKVTAIRYGYSISKAGRRRESLLELNRRLRVEVALLKRPERVCRLAAERGLNSARPEQLRYLTVRTGHVVAKAGAARVSSAYAERRRSR